MKSCTLIIFIFFLSSIWGFSPYLNQGENYRQIGQKWTKSQPSFTMVEVRDLNGRQPKELTYMELRHTLEKSRRRLRKLRL